MDENAVVPMTREEFLQWLNILTENRTDESDLQNIARAMAYLETLDTPDVSATVNAATEPLNARIAELEESLKNLREQYRRAFFTTPEILNEEPPKIEEAPKLTFEALNGANA